MPPPFGGTLDFSPSLGTALGKYCPESSAGEEQYDCTDEQYLLHPTAAPDIAGEWEPAGPVLSALDGKESITLEEGASQNLCHVVIGSGESPLLPEAEGVSPLYDVQSAPAGGCSGGGPGLRLVAVKNTLGPHGEPEELEPRCCTGGLA